MSGTNTGPSVFDGFVRDGKFAQVMANHIGLDFYLVESLQIETEQVSECYFMQLG